MKLIDYHAIGTITSRINMKYNNIINSYLTLMIEDAFREQHIRAYAHATYVFNLNLMFTVLGAIETGPLLRKI